MSTAGLCLIRGASLALSLVVFARSALAQGVSPVSAEFIVNTNVSGRQSVPAGAAVGDGDFLITWTSEPDREKQHIALRRIGCGALPGQAEVSITASLTDGDNSGGVIAATQAEALVAWGENRIDPTVPGDLRDYSIISQRVTFGGTPKNAPFRPLGFQLGNEFHPAIATTSTDDYVIVWTDYNVEPGEPETASRIRWQLVGSDGSHDGIVDVAAYSQRGLPINPDVATTSGNHIVVAWQELGKDGNGDAVLMKRFDRSGASVSDEIVVNSTTIGNQQRPRVISGPDGRVVVLWESQDANALGVFAEIFTSSGERLGGEFQVNQYASGAQQYPAAVSFGRGFLVTWESAGQDGNGFGGFARAFSWSGTPIGDEFQLNAVSAGDQREQHPIADSRGNILVLWTSEQDGDRTGIVGRYFSVDGARCGDRIVDTACRRVSISDALAILRGAAASLDCPICVCDADGSGEVTSSDALVVLRFSVGLTQELACPPCEAPSVAL